MHMFSQEYKEIENVPTQFKDEGFNGCKHVRSLTRMLPKGHEAKKKAKRKAQKAARKVKK